MNTATLKGSSLLSSPFSSPNVSALLKIKIISWSQETGLPVTVRVQIAGRSFNLHKHPLFTKSGYFKRKLHDSDDVELEPNFPGGAETFEMIALFIYGCSTLVDPFNVASLRCAADFLEMTEEYATGNLSERFDIYLNQVVLQSWDDTLIVLRKCQLLLPLAEELLIVSRCIESLAFMACMEILDPERRRDQPVVTLDGLAGQGWCSDTVKAILNRDLWIKDLIALPFHFFKRIIFSLRRQGMKEKYIGPIIVFYASKWVLSECEDRLPDNRGVVVSALLEGILDLLPTREKTCKAIPVDFYLSLLSKSLKLGVGGDRIEKLRYQIASVLPSAQADDFLLPTNLAESVASSAEVATMESIFSIYVSSSNKSFNNTPSPGSCNVADLWDLYLCSVAADPELGPKRFMDLIEVVPISFRQSHDHLYRALNNYLQAHPGISQDEKGYVCNYLNCQKLSQEACVEAVQNELMPLRLIVQALFVQQLNTHQAFKECSDSFRYTQAGEFSGSLSSSRYANSKSQYLCESPYTDGEAVSRPLSLLLQKDVVVQNSELSRKEYESTSFRIQNLEQELMTLKKSLRLQNICTKTEHVTKETKPCGLEGRTLSKKRNPLGQVSACIGSVNFATNRKYVSRLLKVFRRFSFFGRGRTKRKTGANAIWP